MDLKPAELAEQLRALHVAAAFGLSLPELVISEQEATALAKSMLKVAEFYPVSVNPKHAAIIGLVVTAGMIYGPRGLAIAKKANARKPRTSGATDNARANVIQFPQEPVSPQASDPAHVVMTDAAPLSTPYSPAGARSSSPVPEFIAPMDNGNGGQPTFK